MRTKEKALKDAIASGAVVAWSKGDCIQFAVEVPPGSHGHDVWHRWDPQNHPVAPNFDDARLIWRIDPKQVKEVAFNERTCPKGSTLWRKKGCRLWMSAHGWTPNGIQIVDGSFVGYAILAADWEYSLDRGDTWKPAITFVIKTPEKA